MVIARIGGDDGGDIPEPGQGEGDEQAEHSDDQLHAAIRDDERAAPIVVTTVSPPSAQVGADTEAGHEDGDDQGGRVDRVAEDVAELANPDHLIDEAARPGEEEQ